eukprot:g3696.t1
MSANAADEAKRMSRLHQAWIVDTLESHGGSCTYGKLVEVGEEHQCDTVGSMIKYLKSKKVSTCWQVITFGPGYLMFPMHAGEEVTLLDKSILGDLTEALADAKAQAEGSLASDNAKADADEGDDLVSQVEEVSIQEASGAEPDAAGFYTLEQLQSTPLPPGVDKTKRESYLDDQSFESLFGMDKASFAALPGWKRNAAKKKHKLF